MAARLSTIVETFRPDLSRYQRMWNIIHGFPEIAGRESNVLTAACRHLTEYGFEHPRPSVCGIAGVLENGKGNVVVLRTRLDAQPGKEMTDCFMTSRCEAVDPADGILKPVMHGEGHDLDAMSLMAAIELLCRARHRWAGTLIVFFERGHPSTDTPDIIRRKLLVDPSMGLMKMHKPDIILAQRSAPLRAGTVRIRNGMSLLVRQVISIHIPLALGYENNSQMTNDLLPVLAALSGEMTRVSLSDGQVHSVRADKFYTFMADPGKWSGPTLRVEFDVRAETRRGVERLAALLEDAGARAYKKTVNGDEDVNVIPAMPWPGTLNKSGITGLLGEAFSHHLGAHRVENSRLPAPVFQFDDSLGIVRTSFAHLRPLPAIVWFYGRAQPEEFSTAFEGSRDELLQQRQRAGAGGDDCGSGDEVTTTTGGENDSDVGLTNGRHRGGRAVDAASRSPQPPRVTGSVCSATGATATHPAAAAAARPEDRSSPPVRGPEISEDEIFDTPYFRMIVPFNGSPECFPAVEKALATGTECMALAALLMFAQADDDGYLDGVYGDVAVECVGRVYAQALGG